MTERKCFLKYRERKVQMLMKFDRVPSLTLLEERQVSIKNASRREIVIVYSIAHLMHPCIDWQSSVRVSSRVILLQNTSRRSNHHLKWTVLSVVLLLIQNRLRENLWLLLQESGYLFHELSVSLRNQDELRWWKFPFQEILCQSISVETKSRLPIRPYMWSKIGWLIEASLSCLHSLSWRSSKNSLTKTSISSTVG